MRHKNNHPERNLSHRDRVRGGEHSARQQKRDDYGRFDGKGTVRKFWDRVSE